MNAITKNDSTLISQDLKTTSLIIAEKFGKRHDNVLRAIQLLEIPQNYRLLNFEELKINDLTGESTSHVDMTRDGFSLLVMGFTGKKAMVLEEVFDDQRGNACQHKARHPLKEFEFSVYLDTKKLNIVLGGNRIAQGYVQRIRLCLSLLARNARFFQLGNIGQFIKSNCTHTSCITENGLKFNNKATALTRVSEYDSSVAHVGKIQRVGITNLSVYWRSQPRLIFKRGFFMVGRSEPRKRTVPIGGICNSVRPSACEITNSSGRVFKPAIGVQS